MRLSDFKHDLRTAISMRGWGARLVGMRPRNRVLVVRRNSDIVIEGYPRCANTFSVVAFKQAQGRYVGIAHHLHAAGQILLAERWGIPAILLIREPVDAIVSLKIRHPELDTRRCLRDYVAFYGALQDIKDFPVIADFRTVTADFGNVIHSVNQRFGTRFSLFNNSKNSIDAVFAEIDAIRRSARRSISQIAAPNPEKEARKKEIREYVLAEMDESARDAAQSLYEEFMSQASTARDGTV